jgi:hypothetical protein
MVDERLDAALCLRTIMDLTRISEIGELHQDRDAAHNAARRIPGLAQHGRVLFDALAKPTAHDPIDRLGH